MRLLAVLVALVTLVAPAYAEDGVDPLAPARQMYNERRFDEAIAAAEAVRELPGVADSADLVAARAYLERHRQTADEQDLANAHERLRRINPEAFDNGERTEYAIGLGATLYFEDLPGAAAAAFWSLLEADHGLEGEARDRLLDWWASATDRDARPRAEPERRRLYESVHERMRLELSANPASPVAAYWLAAAAAGQADWQRAWDEAQAAWVRAPLMSDSGAMLRPDLDRLVRRAIAPERAKATGRTAEELLAEWDAFTAKWSR
ncbi:MAG: hypothetical protein AB7F99_03070 [Vicinamibacterales bacterium]